MLVCDVCGRDLDPNLNETGFTKPDGALMALCGLHHEAAKRVASDGRVDWKVMGEATFRLNRLRPDIRTEPEKWADWDPLARLVELYKKLEAEHAP